jgi:dipeptidase D
MSEHRLISVLAPSLLWQSFVALNEVPRPSKKEEKVIAFMLDFAKSLGLEVDQDAVGNIRILKPATAGMESLPVVTLQSHLDMVHQKNKETVFDFNTQGIQMVLEGDWVKAKGTTLGADNGIGVAAIMALLQATDIPHGPLEALFTVDEETGMTGAKGLAKNWLSGKFLLNLDTEDDDEISIGCAGGIDITVSASFDVVALGEDLISLTLKITGLQGGHSGMDIHKGLGNANKIMNRLLFDGFENFGLQVAEINGGSLRNAIPRESVAKIIVAKMYDEAYVFDMQEIINDIKNEYKTTEPNLVIEITKSELPSKVMDLGVQEGIIRSIYAAHNGVYRMSADMKDLVETSNNVARIIIKEGEITIGCLTRSSVETSKFDLANSLRSVFELCGCEVTLAGSYPGWTPNVNSEILDVLVSVYEKQNNEKPKVVACHAGLECGILGTNYPEMDMISFGPTIHGAHSPDERASIKSSQKFWKFVLEILENIPLKK